MSNYVSVFAIQSAVAYNQDRLEKKAVKRRTAHAESNRIMEWQAGLEPHNCSDPKEKPLPTQKALPTNKQLPRLPTYEQLLGNRGTRERLKRFFMLEKKKDLDMESGVYGNMLGDPVGAPEGMSQVGDEEVTALPQIPEWGTRSNTRATLRTSEETTSTRKSHKTFETEKSKKLTKFRKLHQ